jgi:hypothetical protein
MKKKTRSILEELNSLGRRRDTVSLIETRGANIIESSVNLFQLIREQYSAEEAGELERRFLNAIRGGDARKFVRGVKKIQEMRDSPESPQKTPLSE